MFLDSDLLLHKQVMHVQATFRLDYYNVLFVVFPLKSFQKLHWYRMLHQMLIAVDNRHYITALLANLN